MIRGGVVAFIVVAALVVGCLRPKVRSIVDCPSVAPLDSLIAEIRHDSIVEFPAGGRATRIIHLKKDITFGGPGGDSMTVFVVEPAPRYSGFYRIGVKRDQAFRLRGWTCDNLEMWLRELPPRPLSSVTSVWFDTYRLAYSLNPVGDSTKIFDAAGSTSLPAHVRLSTLSIPQVRQPTLNRTSDGGWAGLCSVFWYNSQGHGQAAVSWSFRFDRAGRLSYLEEHPLRTGTDTSRVLLGSRPPTR
jgi:hypothetical protein